MTRTSRQGLTSVQYWVLVGMGIGAICLVITNVFMARINGQARQELNQRQRFIDQSVKLGRLHNELVQGLANLSARSGDEELRAILAKHGINFTVTEKAADAAADHLSEQLPETADQGATGQ